MGGRGAAAEAGARSGGWIALRLPHGVSNLFEDWLRRNLPDRRRKILNRIRSIRGGRLNDPRFGSCMKGHGPFSEQIRAIFKLAAERARLGSSPTLSAACFRRPQGPQLELFRVSDVRPPCRAVDTIRRMFSKVLVANRGEIATRVMRTCRELGIATVAVYSDVDRWARFVGNADQAVPLGASEPGESYLNIEKIVKAAVESEADAIHPGYGFLSENPEFAEACRKAGIAFIGPSAKAIRQVGNKLSARRLALQAGVPVVPGTEAVNGPPDDATTRKIGFPLLLKASAGGGGRGQRVVHSRAEFDRAFREASQEAKTAFGNPTLYIERYIDAPRHIEVQIMGDKKGNLIHLHERECSLQRRHQKLVEETPSPALTPALRSRMAAAALRIGRAAEYDNAGTVEFLLDSKGRFYFLEVNSRLQVEHPVTEMAAGLDLVRLQILSAAGRKLPLTQRDVAPRGHAIECRILAEDPHAGFAPSLGEVQFFRLPGGPFVRVDTDLTFGMHVTRHYDSLIAKLIVWGATREEAIRRMTRAIREFKVVGVRTSIPFHLAILADKAFLQGRFHTKYVETSFRMPEAKGDARLAALLAASIEFVRRERAEPRTYTARPVSAWKAAARRELPK